MKYIILLNEKICKSCIVFQVLNNYFHPIKPEEPIAYITLQLLGMTLTDMNQQCSLIRHCSVIINAMQCK